MPTATFTKTIQTALLTLQSLASNSVVASSVLDVSTKLSASVYLHFGRRAATALTTGLTYRVEGSAHATAHGHWFPLAQFITNIAAVGDEAVSGTCAAAQAVVAMASTTGFTVGDVVYIDNTTIANSEWGRIKTVTSNTSITLEDNLVNAQTGATVYAGAQIFTAANLDLSGVKRLRVVANGSGTGQAVALQAQIITCDSIG
jgi:hypothetical protein